MTANGWLQIGLFALVIIAATRPIGIFMFRVLEGEKHPLSRLFGPLERGLYRVCGIDPRHEQEVARATTDATVQHLRAATVETRVDVARALGHLTHICALLAERLDDDQAERRLLLARLRERELGRPRPLEASRSA